MTNQEILKKAIEKAIKNGWDKHENWGEIADIRVSSDAHNFWIEYSPHGDGECFDSWRFIFSHDFAKAFWTIGSCHCGKNGHSLNSVNCPKRQWQYHLQQIVLEEDPIKYLEKFL